MKSLLVLALISAPAFAAPKAKSVSFEQMKKDMKTAADVFSDEDGCNIQVKLTRTGLVVSAQDDKKTKAYLDISDDSKITVVTKSNGEDSTYEVKGEGSLNLVYAEDAFDSFSLTDRSGKVVSCEVDM